MITSFIPALKYMVIALRHKWAVFLVGRKLRVSLWRRITHDWTKLLWWNLVGYGWQFCGSADRPNQFIHTWLRHQNAHDHHWEWWIPRSGHNRCESPYPDNEPLSMSEPAVREMIADWMAAGRVYNGRWPDVFNWEWFDNSRERIQSRVHPDTWELINEIIIDLQKWEARCTR